MKLRRHPDNPLLLPLPASDWQAYNVFNPSVIHHNGLFHMHYRAQGLDWVSRIGYAVSEDGIRWNRLQDPILIPRDPWDARGLEDPRVTALDGRFYMCYTAYGSRYAGSGQATHHGGGITPMIAVSENLVSWQPVGPIVTGENNKDHVLFPRRINGRYAALHRRWPQIWIAYSDDLQRWPEEWMAPVFAPRPENEWDEQCVGANGVPIETDQGWLLIYHGYNQDRIYRFGACLLALDDPGRVIRRPVEAILEPLEIWELRGDVPMVVFSCANPVVGGTVYVYYGAGDHVIGLATASLDDLIEFVLHAPD